MPFDASGTFTRVRGADSWKGDATANTPIRADLHDTNDNDFANGLSDCITKTGKTQPTADLPMAGHKLTNLGTPTASADSATKGYVDAAIAAAQASLALPTGCMMPFGKVGTPPAGWLYCNGAAVSRATYANLFAVIGTAYGAGDAVATFNLPDFRGRFARGWNDDGILDPGRVFGQNQTDEFESHNHPASSGNDSPDHVHQVVGGTDTQGAHTHTIDTTPAVGGGASKPKGDFSSGSRSEATGSAGAHSHNINFWSQGANTRHTHAISISNSGGAETRPHNVSVIWIIKT